MSLCLVKHSDKFTFTDDRERKPGTSKNMKEPYPNTKQYLMKKERVKDLERK
jgi:hypothetical protein